MGTLAPTMPLDLATGGAVGRAFVTNTDSALDSRFIGDIAEILVFDVALDNFGRLTVESYLRGRWGF